jgi:hypothetical protein
MGWSLSLGVINGTAVRVHITFLLFLAWIGFAAYARGGQAAAIQSIVYILLLFACVVLHEFGHVLAARRYGIRTPDITLLPIGGVARLERMPEHPRQELVVALAGQRRAIRARRSSGRRNLLFQSRRFQRSAIQAICVRPAVAGAGPDVSTTTMSASGSRSGTCASAG